MVPLNRLSAYVSALGQGALGSSGSFSPGGSKDAEEALSLSGLACNQWKATDLHVICTPVRGSLEVGS